MKASIAVLCFTVLVLRASAQIDDAPAPTAVPFTSEPRQPQWRIGFNLGNVTILETPELNPDNDFAAAVREADRLLPRPGLSFGLALLPFMKVNLQSKQLVNPRQWTILDLEGKSNARSFQGLGIFMGSQMTSTEGGYHLVSMGSMPNEPFLAVRKEPFSGNLIFAFTGNVKSKHLRTKLSETKWENLLPVEDPANLPAGYEAVKESLDDNVPSPPERFIYGTSIEALIRGRLVKLWLLNYSHPDTTKGSHPWGIFMEQSGRLEPLFVNKPSASEEQYVAYFVASIDLDGDGTDELVLEASYRLGTAFKVISASGDGKYKEIHTSYYRGPA